MAKFIKVKGWRSEKDVIDVYVNVEHIVMVHKQRYGTRVCLSLSASDQPHEDHADFALFVEHSPDEVMALIDNAINGCELPNAKNGCELPLAPPLACKELPAYGLPFYVPDLRSDELYIKKICSLCSDDFFFLQKGLVYNSKNKAVLAAKQMLALLTTK